MFDYMPPDAATCRSPQLRVGDPGERPGGGPSFQSAQRMVPGEIPGQQRQRSFLATVRPIKARNNPLLPPPRKQSCALVFHRGETVNHWMPMSEMPEPSRPPWVRPILATCVLAFCFIFAVGAITVCGWVLP